MRWSDVVGVVEQQRFPDGGLDQVDCSVNCLLQDSFILVARRWSWIEDGYWLEQFSRDGLWRSRWWVGNPDRRDEPRLFLSGSIQACDESFVAVWG